MKYHETSFDEYLQSSYKTNFHPELEILEKTMPNINIVNRCVLLKNTVQVN